MRSHEVACEATRPRPRPQLGQLPPSSIDHTPDLTPRRFAVVVRHDRVGIQKSVKPFWMRSMAHGPSSQLQRMRLDHVVEESPPPVLA